MHCQMEIRIIPLDCLKEFLYLDLRIQLFTNLTLQSLLRALPSLHLAAWKLPPALKFTVSALGCEDLAFFDDYCCYYFYCFHIDFSVKYSQLCHRCFLNPRRNRIQRIDF